MKLVLLTLLTFLFFPSVYAQTDSLSEAYSRIKILEETIQQQNARITKLSSDVNEVLNQNLALKKNLNLLPTISSAKLGDSMEYRVIEVNGNSDTREVNVVITANNLTNQDVRTHFSGNEIVDELGNGYNHNNQNYKMKINGVEDDLIRRSVDNHANAPYSINLSINNYAPGANYIKYLSLDILTGTKHNFVIFENLPIKWAK